jgi:spore coat protein A
LVVTARADVVSIGAFKDNTIFGESNSLSNGDGDHFFSGTTGVGNVRRGLVAFDIAAHLPAGSTINSVTLTLSMSRSNGTPEFVSLHRLLTDWGEGTSHASGNEGGGAFHTNNDATWLYARYNSSSPASSEFWVTRGGDFEVFPSDTQTVIGITTYTWGSTKGMVADVQGWLDNPSTNFGWIMIGNEKNSSSSKRFDSKDHSNPNVRPDLTIDFTPPSALGACCENDGSCYVTSMATCNTAGDIYQGDGTTCSPNPCVVITGACCLNDGSCSQEKGSYCTTLGGTYQGDFTVCTNGLCPVVLAPYLDALPIPPVATPTIGTTGLEATYDMEIVQVQQKLHRHLPPTTLWTYDGVYPGPTILATRDLPVTVNWINNLQNSNGTPRTDHYLDVNLCPHGAEDVPKTVVHLHGGHVPAEVDGYPEDAFLPGAMLSYEYPNNQLPGLNWYHDHSLGITRLNVYMGLAGAYVISDAFEQSLGLPTGEFDVPLIMQDRSFNADGSLKYPSDLPDHFFGDTMLVNGMAMPFMDVKKGKYRFRALNGCNSRTLTLSLSNGQSFQQIGTDGGLLPSAVTLTEVTLGPAERADLIVDFSAGPTGTEIELINSAPAPFPGTPGIGVIPDVMKFVVAGATGSTDPIPASLRPLEVLDPLDSVVDREFVLQKLPHACSGTAWKINGLHWNDITEYPRLGTTETWTFINRSGIAHPMHVHLDFFQVLYSQSFFVDGENITTNGPRIPPPPNEAGWKDTVMVPPFKLVKVVMRFEDYAGLYAYHCHILEHEDHDMMRQFRAVHFGDADVDGDVDLADYAVIFDCLNGPGVAPNPASPPPTAAECLEASDADQDGDVDMEDFKALQKNFTG